MEPLLFFIFCNLDSLSFAVKQAARNFNEVISEFLSFCRDIMKVKALFVFAVIYSCYSCHSSLLLPVLYSSTNTWFSIQLSACTNLFDSHLLLSSLIVLYVMSNLVYPQQDVVWGVSLADFHLWETFLSHTGLYWREPCTLAGSNCLLSFVFLLSSKVAAFGAVWMWLTSFPDAQQIFLNVLRDISCRRGKK